MIFQCVRCSISVCTAFLVQACSFSPTAVSAAGTPYLGLDVNSYGQRSVQPVAYCNPQNQASSQQRIIGETTVHDVADAIARPVAIAITSPLRGAMKIDGSLQQEELVRFFSVPADSNFPAVALLEKGGERLVFWHRLELAPLKEVKLAAEAYCGTRDRKVQYMGSAGVCAQPNDLPVEMGGNPIVSSETYVISEFRCHSQ